MSVVTDTDRARHRGLTRGILLWLYVGLALAYGVLETILKASALFTG